MRLVAANINLRFLTRDDERKAAACRELFRRLQRGEELAMTSAVILQEVLYVLTSRNHYQLIHAEAAARLRPLLVLRGLQLPQKRLYLRALDLYGSFANLDFADAMCIARMEQEGIGEIYSYDRDFDAIPGIRRVEP